MASETITVYFEPLTVHLIAIAATQGPAERAQGELLSALSP